MDKPRLFLDAALFAAEADNAFFIEGNTILRREGGRTCTLTVDDGELRFDDGTMTVHLDRDWQVTRLDAATDRSRVPARSGMPPRCWCCYEGISRELPFLLER